MTQLPLSEILGAGHLQEAVFLFNFGKISDQETVPMTVNGEGVINANIRAEEMQVLPLNLSVQLQPLGYQHFQSGPGTLRYFKQLDTFPIIQLGPGLISYNQSGKNYKWEDFRVATLELVEAFLKAYPGNFTKDTDLIFLELRYQNAFVFGDLNPTQYLLEKTNVQMAWPEALFKSEAVEPQILGSRINVGQKSLKPPGIRTVELLQAKFDKELNPGYVMSLAIRSGVGDQISLHSVGEWIDQAHGSLSRLYRDIIK